MTRARGRATTFGCHCPTASERRPHQQAGGRTPNPAGQDKGRWENKIEKIDRNVRLSHIRPSYIRHSHLTSFANKCQHFLLLFYVQLASLDQFIEHCTQFEDTVGRDTGGG